MRGIRRRRAQHHFCVRGELDLAHAAAFVGERQMPDFRVVLARDENLHDRADGAVLAADLGAILEECSFVEFGFPADGNPNSTKLHSSRIAPRSAARTAPSARSWRFSSRARTTRKSGICRSPTKAAACARSSSPRTQKWC